ncbi:MAG TPA: sugar transferase [Planctomycetota bacterium]|jgi:lipopolysaccharide/colanic/teichoic acid biosynthesis glycosyltransferase|nr:sugar transferase [Planctomycetota bacterium]
MSTTETVPMSAVQSMGSGSTVMHENHRVSSRRDAITHPRSIYLDQIRYRLWRVRSAMIPAVRRGIDILLASLGIAASIPIGLLIAIAIKVDDRGPVFFQQIRVGKGGRRFRCFKFRSMAINAEQKKQDLLPVHCTFEFDVVRFKMVSDPRLTRVGRWLRRASLDELPQLMNVLLGDMAIVGPRPPIPEEVAAYSAFAWRRLDVTPGLTCTWQVSGRSNIPFQEQCRMDVAYIENQTLKEDGLLMLKTIPAVLSGKGAF